MHAVHGSADIAGTFPRHKTVEGDEGFSFTAGGVEKRGAKNIHALNVDARFGSAGFGSFCRGR